MIEELIEFEEGYKAKPYYCSEGFVTIGYGTKIGPKNADLSLYQIEFDKEIARLFLYREIDAISESLRKTDFFNGTGRDRSMVIMSMCYQMGFTGLMGFRKMIAALRVKDYEAAAKEMLDSRWARQTPSRAVRHARMMRGERFEEVYKDWLK